MKIGILGTSNSILTDGWVPAFQAISAPGDQVVNYSSGGNSSVYGLYALDHSNLLESCDYVIIDFAVNDQNFLDGGSLDYDEIKDHFFNLIKRVSESGVMALVLLFFNKGHLHSSSFPIKELHTDICRHFGVAYFDIHSAVRGVLSSCDEESVFRDSTHLSSLYARLVALLVKKHVHRSSQLPEISRKHPGTSDSPYHGVPLSRFGGVPAPVKRGTALVTYDCVRIEKEGIEIDFPEKCIIEGFLFKASKESSFVTLESRRGAFAKNISLRSCKGFFFRTLRPRCEVEGKVGIYPFNKSGAVLCKKEQHELPPRADSSYVDIIGVLLRSENVDAVELDGNCQSTDIGSSSFQSLLDTLRFALDGNIDDIETHELLYIIALETSDVRFGLEACEKAIRLFSNNAYYYIQQADLLLQAGEDDKANSAYLKAIELDCSIPEPHFRLSRIHGRRGDMEQAIQRIRDAIAAKDNNPHFYHHLGNLLMNIDDLEGARKAQEKAITLDPSNPGPHIQLSRICHQLGDTAQAILKARDAIGAKDDEPSSYHHLGMLLKRNGDFAGAREALEKAMLMRTSRSEHPAEEGPCASFSADIRSAKADRASAHGLARP